MSAWSTVLVESRRYTASPRSGSWITRSASRRSHSTSRANVGSQARRFGTSIPRAGVTTDWWAPPSGARLMPEGLATRMKRAFEYVACSRGSRPRGRKQS